MLPWIRKMMLVYNKRHDLDNSDQYSQRGCSQKGLTLIECLVAIAVIGLTTATIAPMVVFAVATRVQNQKTEQALQLAQGEIDKVRLIVEQGGDYGDRLIGINLLAATASVASAVPAPNVLVASTASTTSANQAREVDIDGDGDNDFLIQLFRTQGIELPPETIGTTASTPVAFDVGVRVYDARAAANISSLTAESADLTFTSGEGDRGTQPLAVLYSQITQGDRTGSLCQYWEYTGSTPTGLQCN